MTNSDRTVGPAPMEGGGAYNRHSQVQGAGLMSAIALLEQAARFVELAPAPEPVGIADYGASEGHNSLLPMGAAIVALRERIGPDRPVSVIHTDLPSNDFTALFRTLADDPASYLHGDPAAFASAVGRSFYGQILPPDCVTLGWSSWAVQWLSRVPMEIPDHVQVACSRSREARAAFGRQAAEDWRAFLSARGRELRPGGRLVVVAMAVGDDGEFGYGSLLDALYLAILGFVGEGFLREEEVRRIVIPTVGRSRAEFADPFGPAGCFGGLSIEHLEVFDADDRIWANYQAAGDAGAFGRQWAAFSRASVFPTLAAGLNGGSCDPRYGPFLNRLEADVASRLAVSPVRMRIPLAKMSLIKRNPPC